MNAALKNKQRRKYAENARKTGELSVVEAAARIGLCTRTVRNHARDVVAGTKSNLITAARRDRGGRYWIPSVVVDAAARGGTDPDAAVE